MQAASEDELRLALGLAGYTTGKGKADLKDSNIRPIEVFMCSVVRLRPSLPEMQLCYCTSALPCNLAVAHCACLRHS